MEMGITEQNMASLASGMAAVGKIPFISSYAMFSPGRNWEQIRTTICYNNQNVKIAGAHSGVSVGPDGATHQAIEDIAITRVIPNMVVIAPCDSIEAKKATIAAASYKGPVYIRFTREKTPVITTEETPFEIGKAEIFREGNDVTIIGCGPLVYEALKATEELAKEGIEAEVINNHTIKPMDKETILESVKKDWLCRNNRRTSDGGRNGFGCQRNIIAKSSRPNGNNRGQRPLRRIGRAKRAFGKIRLDGRKYSGGGENSRKEKVKI